MRNAETAITHLPVIEYYHRTEKNQLPNGVQDTAGAQKTANAEGSDRRWRFRQPELAFHHRHEPGRRHEWRVGRIVPDGELYEDVHEPPGVVESRCEDEPEESQDVVRTRGSRKEVAAFLESVLDAPPRAVLSDDSSRCLLLLAF